MSHKLVSLYIKEGEYYTRTDTDNVLAEKDAEIAQLQAMLDERNKQVGKLKTQKAQAEYDCAFWKNLAQKNATDNEVKAKQRTEAIKHYMELADKLKEGKK